MHGCCDVWVLDEDAVDQRPVRDVTLVEGVISRELASSGYKVVENHRLLTIVD